MWWDGWLPASRGRFSGDDGAFAVAYPAEESADAVAFDPPGVKGVELTFFGEPTSGRTAHQIVQQPMDVTYPGAATDCEILDASVGCRRSGG